MEVKREWFDVYCEVVRGELHPRLFMMEDDIEVFIHHRRKFVNEGSLKYEGETDTLSFDLDLWSYFVVVSVVKGLGMMDSKDKSNLEANQAISSWMKITEFGGERKVAIGGHLGCSSLGKTLQWEASTSLGRNLAPLSSKLSQNVDPLVMARGMPSNGGVHLFMVIHMIEYVGDETREEVAPMLHENGEGVHDGKYEEDGGQTKGDGDVTQELGETREKDDGEGVSGSETKGDGGLREDLDERREIDDSEGLGGRETNEDGGLIQDLGGSETHGDGGITQELGDMGDIEEQVHEYEPTTFVEEEVIVGDWSTSNDDGNGEVNSMKGLVDINFECDLRERDYYGNMHVEVESSDMSELDLDDDDISFANDSDLLNNDKRTMSLDGILWLYEGGGYMATEDCSHHHDVGGHQSLHDEEMGNEQVKDTII
ncbi:hypothetical protein V8G54_028016 [Vigna mungo]|uniref:PB1-like domain-containing protein n=1 Tax=Vigna mungo TaxID=3915 RepID=A0AAQ3MRU4_VIGMU